MDTKPRPVLAPLYHTVVLSFAAAACEDRLSFDVLGDVDASLAAYLGYLYLDDEMSNFPEQLPILCDAIYLFPTPELPPNIEIPDPTEAPLESDSELGVSMWTIGGVIIASTGGLVALWVWFRNRRLRNERHVQMIEDLSQASPLETAPRMVVTP